jgi:hypothetical protein
VKILKITKPWIPVSLISKKTSCSVSLNFRIRTFCVPVLLKVQKNIPSQVFEILKRIDQKLPKKQKH